MRIIAQSRKRKVFATREVYSDQDGNEIEEFLLSSVEAVKNTRRPIARFDSKQELELAALNRNCQVTWQTS